MSRRSNKSESLRLAITGLLVLGLAACSQDSEPEQAAGGGASTPAPAPEPQAEPVFDREPVAPSPTAEEDLVGRGEYLVEGLVGCGNCHHGRDENGEFVPGMEYAGNFVIEEPIFTAYAPNITPDPETGIGEWTDEEIERAIRSGISRDGRMMGPPMAFYPYYHGIASDDMDAIIAYLRTVPAVRNEVPLSELRMELPPSWGPPVEEPIVAPPKSDQVAYGRYLAHNLGHCSQCHTPLVNGVEDFSREGAGMNLYPRPFGYDWAAISANITSHETLGVGAWTDDEIKRAIVYGISRDGRELLPFMGFSFYERISDEDLDAIVAYMRSLPPAEATPPAPEAE
ncbi:MAG TPA: c-type cytochrome [Gammaproteobacteria bacterium]|nr:c-type cytochrome [Gammaproteobacteria bacterium]